MVKSPDEGLCWSRYRRRHSVGFLGWTCGRKRHTLARGTSLDVFLRLGLERRRHGGCCLSCSLDQPDGSGGFWRAPVLDPAPSTLAMAWPWSARDSLTARRLTALHTFPRIGLV